MNFTFLPSSSVLIHSSSRIFVSLQTRSVYVASCREYTLFGARNRGWGMKSRLLGIWHSNGARRTTTDNCLAASLCPNEQLSFAKTPSEQILTCVTLLHPSKRAKRQFFGSDKCS